MPEKLPVDEAVVVAQLIENKHPPESPSPGLIDVVREFSKVEFEVPDIPDSDGYLFEYGDVSWFPDSTFVLSILRQLEVVDSSGKHDHYVQILFEFRYPLDDDLKAMGSHSEWWFPGHGVSLEAWLDSVGRSTVMEVIAAKTPSAFEIHQDQA